MISPDTARRIHETADVLEVVQDYLSLKKKGSNYWACCPFHGEKTPSFSVAPAKGIYKCFSCGKGGDAVSFIREIEGVSYPEALRVLAKKYNIEVEEDKPSAEVLEERSQREKLYLVLQYAKNFFHYHLTQTSEGKTVGLGYFKERGFDENVINKFELGYAPDEWEALKTDAQKKGYSIEQLQKAGLLATNEQGKQYDRFRGRVIFPIHSLSGKPIAFGARTLKKDEKPKYINSPETEVYQKSDVLYGIFQAKNAIRLQDNCYLVEGYTDVISMHQAGVENVVASSGTSLTEGQIAIIKRFTTNVTVLYDGDAAGIKASLRGIDMLLAQDLNVNVVLFPDGEDPDSFAKKVGAETFKRFLKENTQDFIQFKGKLLLKDANSPQQRATAIKSMIESVVQMPDVIKRSAFQREIAKLFAEDEQLIISESNRILLERLKAQERIANRLPLPERNVPHAFSQTSPPPFTDIPPPTDEYEVKITAGHDQEENLPEFINFTFSYSEEPQNDLQAQELENLRILVLYGYLDVGNGQKLYEYILEECSDMVITNTYYAAIHDAYLYEVYQGHDISPQALIHHPDERLSRFVVSQLSEKYVLSPHWEKQGVIVPKKDENLALLSYKNILKRKFNKLAQNLKQALKFLETSENIEQQNESLELYEFYHAQKRQIAKELGIVINA